MCSARGAKPRGGFIVANGREEERGMVVQKRVGIVAVVAYSFESLYKLPHLYKW